MIIVAHGYVCIDDCVTIFTGSEAVPCPVCSGRLTVHGTCRRKLRTKEGAREYRLRVMDCSECGRTHRELPKSVIPYKRMDVGSVAEIANSDASEHLQQFYF